VKHALITGGAGFIGSHLAECLLAEDYRVTVIDDESTGSVENLATIRDHFNFSFVPGTAADKALMRRLLGDVDEVYHLAAAVGVQLINTAPIHTIETNVYPTELLLSEMLRRAQEGSSPKLFLASSSEVYGKNPKPQWNEDDNLVFGPTTRPRWAYGASKAIDEFLALAYWREHQLPVVIGRFFNVVGPRQTGRYGMVLPRFVDAALNSEPLVVHGDGMQIRCFAHVLDVVRSVIELMQTDAAVAGVFNIGSDEPVTILQLAQKVLTTVRPSGQASIVFQSYADAFDKDFEDVRCRVPDLTRLQNTIDYRASHTLEMIITEVVEHTRLQLRKQAMG
jgi:UDP-glucose 4-epimerase